MMAERAWRSSNTKAQGGIFIYIYMHYRCVLYVYKIYYTLRVKERERERYVSPTRNCYKSIIMWRQLNESGKKDRYTLYILYIYMYVQYKSVGILYSGRGAKIPDGNFYALGKLRTEKNYFKWLLPRFFSSCLYYYILYTYTVLYVCTPPMPRVLYNPHT